MRRKNISW